jgi:hypothetical protein
VRAIAADIAQNQQMMLQDIGAGHPEPVDEIECSARIPLSRIACVQTG